VQFFWVAETKSADCPFERRKLKLPCTDPAEINLDLEAKTGIASSLSMKLKRRQFLKGGAQTVAAWCSFNYGVPSPGCFGYDGSFRVVSCTPHFEALGTSFYGLPLGGGNLLTASQAPTLANQLHPEAHNSNPQLQGFPGKTCIPNR